MFFFLDDDLSCSNLYFPFIDKDIFSQIPSHSFDNFKNTTADHLVLPFLFYGERHWATGVKLLAPSLIRDVSHIWEWEHRATAFIPELFPQLYIFL